jgi:ArsR family transcriptional regulator
MDDPLTHPQDDSLALLAKALAHPARLRILRLLARTPGCIGGDIVQAVGLAQSTVSEHLRILKSAGVIEGQIDPPRVCYALSSGALAPLAALIAQLDAIRIEAGLCIDPVEPPATPKRAANVSL